MPSKGLLAIFMFNPFIGQRPIKHRVGGPQPNVIGDNGRAILRDQVSFQRSASSVDGTPPNRRA
jgi:hypothetical protein